jgi:hypothetical protein
LTWIKASVEAMLHECKMVWSPTTVAPFDCNLQLAVIDWDGAHVLVFPCRRILGGWIDAETKERIDLRPTHWREWRHRI